MINDAADFNAARQTLQRHGRVQIADFLQRDAAERLAACLRDEVPWTTAERGQPDSGQWSPQVRSQRMPAAYRAAAAGFHFVYDRYLIVDAMREGRDPHLAVHDAVRYFNSPEFFALVRDLTGDRELMMVGAQATRYLPGQFLRVHDDRHDEENRRYAYVLNLSRDWQPDWGGMLHFVDDNGGPHEAFLPRFNSLSLFKVPMKHYVGFVTPWARGPRLAITGWWHAKPRA